MALVILIMVFIQECASAQTGLTKFEDIGWNNEKTAALSPAGKESLSIPDIDWKHGETEHFVFHFTQRWMGERAAAEAETYYGLIKKDLRIKEDQWELKGQIFLFESEPTWKTFIEKVGVDRWSGGASIGNDIFFLSPPKANPFTGHVLPHELSHLIVGRFVNGKIPLWLNEGIAEQQSRKHFNGYTKPKGFYFPNRPNVVSAERYIPISEIAAAAAYPEDVEKVTSFYTESVRFVQFLVEDHRQDFISFVQLLADGSSLEDAMIKIYGSQYRTLEAFETEFKKVAISKAKASEDPKP